MANVAQNASITVATLEDAPTAYLVGTKDSMIDGTTDGWGFEDYPLSGTETIEYNFIVSLGQLYNTEDITFTFQTENIDVTYLTTTIEVESGIPYTLDTGYPTNDVKEYTLTGYTKFIKVQMFVQITALVDADPTSFSISDISVTADDNDYPRNIAVQGTPTGSMASDSSRWSVFVPTYWQQFLTCGKITRDQFRAFHDTDYTTTQEDSVTLTCDVAFDTETTVKKHKAYLYVYANFYLDNYYDITSRFYIWNGYAWSLEDTQTYSYISTAEGVTFGFVADGDWSTTKCKWEFDLDYKLNWREDPDNLTYGLDAISFGVSELELYQNEVIEDVNWLQTTTTTISGTSSESESPYYMTDGFSDVGSGFGIGITQPLVVYDTIVDLDQSYNITTLLCNFDIEALVIAYGSVEATVNWELQVYTTGWQSVQTGSFDISYSEGQSGGSESYPSAALGVSSFGSASKTRFIASLDSVDITNSVVFVKFLSFLAFTSDTTAIDIGLHIGSETIGAVVANESPLKIYVNGTTYSLPLVATTDSTASATRIYTDSVKALRKIS